jgi:hypothetical protein
MRLGCGRGLFGRIANLVGERDHELTAKTF